MKLGKVLAVTGLGVSPLGLTVASLKMVDLTLVLGVLLIPNPATQVLGSVVVGTLLLNFVTGFFLGPFQNNEMAYLL